MKRNAPSPAPHSLSLFANPLTVQFWLFGLDASGGLLQTRGFGRGPELRHGKVYGSSRYGLDGLELHSSGLTLHLPQGELTYHRPRQSFRLNGEPVARSAGLALLQPHIHQHEAWAERHLPGLRARQLGASLPRPVRRQVGAWDLWVTQVLELETWQPGFRGRPSGYGPYRFSRCMVSSPPDWPRTPDSARTA